MTTIIARDVHIHSSGSQLTPQAPPQRRPQPLTWGSPVVLKICSG
jgi:hypothetical protein